MLAIFVFHNKTRHRIMNLFTFSKSFKHVDIYVKQKEWIGFRMTRNGIEFAMSGYENGRYIVNGAIEQPNVEAILCLDIHGRAEYPWIPLTIPMCNEFSRYLSGVDISFSWNPRNLYNKLLKYDHKRNYEIFFQWRRSHG
jgi:hypothetical protein